MMLTNTQMKNARPGDDLGDVRAITRAWLRRYNNRRTHDSLGGMTPAGYARSGLRPGTGEKQRESETRTSLL